MAANLSRVSEVTRKFLEITGISIAAIILLVVVFNVSFMIKNILSPTPPAPPSVSFGKLNLVDFPLNSANNMYSYTINTLTGTLPTLPDRIAVYKMIQAKPDLLGLDKAIALAQKINFLSTPSALSETEYQWTKTDPLPTTLTMNIQTFDFFLTSDYKSNQTVLEAIHMPDETTAQGIAKQFFDTFMPLSSSIDPAKTKISLLAIQGNSLVPASSLSTAQIIRIDYLPKTVDTYPVYTAIPDQSLTYALIASGDTDTPQVVEAQYYHKDISNDKATYPLITAQQAFALLKEGKAYIAANPSQTTHVNITNVSLGYYLTPFPQRYLWPIIVFQGDQGFYAYVNAIKDTWIQK